MSDDWIRVINVSIFPVTDYLSVWETEFIFSEYLTVTQMLVSFRLRAEEGMMRKVALRDHIKSKINTHN